MQDDQELRDVDRELRSLLQHDDAGVGRVVAAALLSRPSAHYASRRVTAVAGVAVLLALAATLWFRTPDSPPPLQITGAEGIIVVTRPDGSRLVYDTSPSAPARGEYVIVIPTTER